MPAEAQRSTESPSLAASIPEDGAANIPLQGLIPLRFSQRLSVTTVNSVTVILSGAKDLVPITIIPAEAGMLAFATYKGSLLPGTTDTLSLSGLADAAGRQLPQTQISFTTATPASASALGDEAWTPNGRTSERTGRIHLGASCLRWKRRPESPQWRDKS